MKCKECKTGRALVLFSSVLCNNRNCKKYDKKWAKEVEKEEEDLLALDLGILSNNCYAMTATSNTTFTLRGKGTTLTYTVGNGSNSYTFEWSDLAL